MNNQAIEQIITGINAAFKASAENSEQHAKAVQKSLQAIGNQFKEHENDFEAMRDRVQTRLKSGPRRTHGDPV
ncbi:hypothetical protein [Desulfonatronospira sp.]|uniref:hypothetical protein n=1 Tax=Desulfonatronospira sp. TaxID=1962951 RepID=UPI0025C1BD47|nr:hypothetical protein [Desulfonatronospira sp.]